MARACVFCGDNATTLEHVWPQWLRSLFSDDPVTHYRGTGAANPWDAPPFTIRTRFVCAKCNNGWMSNLESRAMHLLIPMIQGAHWHGLVPVEQQLVSTWVIKTAMMFQMTLSQGLAIPSEHYGEVYAQNRPPRQSKIALGYYSGQSYRKGRFYCQPLSLARRPDDGLPGGPNGYAITLTIGRFIAQVYGYRANRDIVVRHRDIAEWLLVIWPTSKGVKWWPPLDEFDDRKLFLLENSVFRGFLYGNE